MNRSATGAALLAASLLLTGCGDKPKSAGSAAAARTAAAYKWPGRDKVAKAILLLNQGKPVPARKLLAEVVQRHADDAVATKLMQQIDTDPKLLLGSESFAYVTRPREGFATLAQRFLGDPNLFYALARYNRIDVPGRLATGTTVRIPGRERREATAPPPRPQPARAAPPAAAAPPVTASPAAPPRPATANPARAVQLRAAGLEQMNRGAIGRAVVLLEEASRLDPANPLIRRDLERAVRIRRTVANGR